MFSKIIYSQKARSAFAQIIFVLLISCIAYTMYSNASGNLSRQNIATGFDFLGQRAGFALSESMVSYNLEDSYFDAFLAGFLNTIKVSFIGNILAVFLGIIIGLCRLSPNWLISRCSMGYIEVLRNVPLLLQLFFWYALFTDIFPGVRQAHNFFSFYISNRGISIPILEDVNAMKGLFLTLVFSLLTFFPLKAYSLKKKERSGQDFALFRSWLLISSVLLIAVWVIYGAPLNLDRPKLTGFNFNGGYTFSPEFISLLLGLVLYTSAFNAEIIRSGIESIPKGQWEASYALGLNRAQTLWKVVLPQGLRVIIPPLTSQVLNLTKNSSLAVAIAYPDFVMVSNTVLNQTGQAIEVISLIMLIYLIISLSTSFFMNWYNSKVALVER